MRIDKKRLQRIPWHIYAALVAFFLWALVLGIYVGEAVAQAALEPSFESGMVEIEPVEPAEALAKADSPSPIYTEDELQTLALIIYQEAGGDACSDETRLMVGTVVLNRVADDRYPDTIQDVALQRKQYGRLYWTGLVWPERADQPQEAHAVERAYTCAQALLDGYRALPEDVVFQAEFPQGTETVARQDGIYFCR